MPTLGYHSFLAVWLSPEAQNHRAMNSGRGGRGTPGAHAQASQNQKQRGAGHGGGGRGCPRDPPRGARSGYAEWMGTKCPVGGLGLWVTGPRCQGSPGGSGQLGGARLCVRVFVLSGRLRRFGRGVECELRPVQGSRVGVSGGAGTK